MEIIIVEDEHAAAENLKAVIHEVLPWINIQAVLESVEDSIQWLQNNPHPHLAFFDIQLADGQSFDIFDRININFPVIFTTAYNEYAIKAFKVNSIDYILKPVNSNDVEHAVNKFLKLNDFKMNYSSELINFLETVKQKKKDTYKKAILVHYKDKLIPLQMSEISYIFIDSGSVYAVTLENKKYVIDFKLDKLEEVINPDDFFRANRQFLISRKGIKEINLYFNGRLVIKTKPESTDKIIISKAKASIFKKWLDN